ELERLLNLVHRHQLPGAPEEGVARRRESEWQGELRCQMLGPRLPGLTELDCGFRRADADIFPHAERLHAPELGRSFASEAIRLDVDDSPAQWHVAASGNDRIDLIACRWRQHEVRRRQSI